MLKYVPILKIVRLNRPKPLIKKRVFSPKTKFNKMKFFNLVLIFSLFTSSLFSQYATVTFDPAMRTFNNFEPLPSEEDMMFTGAVPANVNVVEFQFFRGKNKNYKDPLYVANWERGAGDESGAFKLPINYKLNANKKYDIRVKYFQKVKNTDREKIYGALKNNLDAYLGQSLQSSSEKIKLTKRSKEMMKDLNTIVNYGLREYRITNGVPFEGFSDLVKGQIEAIDDKKLNEVLFDASNTSQAMASAKYRDQLIQDLQTLIHAEVRFVLNSDISRLINQYDMDDLKTESRNGYFSINVGYGAVYIDGNIDNLEYGTAPYVGLAFPLSTSTIAPKFFRNASVTLGIFTKNFNDVGDRGPITGPIVKRPIYLGLDYKLFQFIRFNVGAAALEEESENTGTVSGIENRVFFRPFVGLSAKINLSIGLDK